MSATSERALHSYDVTPVGNRPLLARGATTEVTVDGYTRFGTVTNNGIFHANFGQVCPGYSGSHVFVSMSESTLKALGSWVARECGWATLWLFGLGWGGASQRI
jgi:hypothetical protein